MESRTIGVIGGGPSGRLLAQAASSMGIRLAILDPDGFSSPAGQLSQLCIEGSYDAADKINDLSAIVDILTVETEFSVNCTALQKLESLGVPVVPNVYTIKTLQDKLRMKQYLSAHSIDVGDFMNTPTLESAKEAAIKWGYPFLLKQRKKKRRRQGVGGASSSSSSSSTSSSSSYGQGGSGSSTCITVSSENDLEDIFAAAAIAGDLDDEDEDENGTIEYEHCSPFYAESITPVVKELSLVCICFEEEAEESQLVPGAITNNNSSSTSTSNSTSSSNSFCNRKTRVVHFPLVETFRSRKKGGNNAGISARTGTGTGTGIGTEGICMSIMPAQVPALLAESAKKVALSAVRALQSQERGAAVAGGRRKVGADMVDSAGSCRRNSAPALFTVDMFVLQDDTILINKIVPRATNAGCASIEACDISQYELLLRAVLQWPCHAPSMRSGATALSMHVLGESSLGEASAVLQNALRVPCVRAHWYGATQCVSGIPLGHITLTANSVPLLKQRFDDLSKISLSVSVASGGGGSAFFTSFAQFDHGLLAQGPLVSIVVDREGDVASMKQTGALLSRFGVPFEMTIISAHQTPTRLYTYAQGAAERNIKVIIAAASHTGHLPGMVAALTTVPVIGVPLSPDSGGTSGGSCSSCSSGVNNTLISMAQMTEGVPIAVVSLNGAVNAALLAVRILSSTQQQQQYSGTRTGTTGTGTALDLVSALEQYQLEEEERVMQQAAKLESYNKR